MKRQAYSERIHAAVDPRLRFDMRVAAYENGFKRLASFAKPNCRKNRGRSDVIPHFLRVNRQSSTCWQPIMAAAFAADFTKHFHDHEPTTRTTCGLMSSKGTFIFQIRIVCLAISAAVRVAELSIFGRLRGPSSLPVASGGISLMPYAMKGELFIA